LLRFLLIREGEVAHRISKKIYGASPLVGLIAGAIAAIEVGRNEGLTSTPMTIFIAIAAIAIADAFAGVAATLGFWAIQLATGNVTSFRDFLIAIAVGIAWVGPSLFAALLRESINRDFESKSNRGADPIKFLGVIGSSLVGGTVFYFGHALINSVIYTENETRSLTGLHILIISVMLMVRGFADGVVLERESELPTRDESFVISRVSSPITAFAVIALICSFVYIWTAAASTAIFVAILFSLPYFLIFVRFNRISFLKTSRLPRNILLESALISGIAFIVFKQISMKPLLIDQRANLLLMLTAVAPIIHSIYSAIYSSNEDKFSFDENSETIRP
jgi:hypothetical protein